MSKLRMSGVVKGSGDCLLGTMYSMRTFVLPSISDPRFSGNQALLSLQTSKAETFSLSSKSSCDGVWGSLGVTKWLLHVDYCPVDAVVRRYSRVSSRSRVPSLVHKSKLLAPPNGCAFEVLSWTLAEIPTCISWLGCPNKCIVGTLGPGVVNMKMWFNFFSLSSSCHIVCPVLTELPPWGHYLQTQSPSEIEGVYHSVHNTTVS